MQVSKLSSAAQHPGNEIPAAKTSLCVAGAEEERVLFKIMLIQVHSEEEAVESIKKYLYTQTIQRCVQRQDIH